MEDISLIVHHMPHRLVSAVYWKHTLWCDTTAMTCNGTNHFLNEDISSNSETTHTFTDIPRSNISYELWWCTNINTRRHHCSEVYTHICWTVCLDPADFSTETCPAVGMRAAIIQYMPHTAAQTNWLGGMTCTVARMWSDSRQSKSSREWNANKLYLAES